MANGLQQLYRSRPERLKKALFFDSQTNNALSSIKLGTEITNTIIALNPEIGLLNLEYNKVYTYYYTRVTSSGGVVPAHSGGANTPNVNSKYNRLPLVMKAIKRKVPIAFFTEDAGQEGIDVVQRELENQLLFHSWDINFYSMYGNVGANPYEFSGWDTWIPSANRTKYHTAGAPTVPTNLKFLDDMIAASRRKGGVFHPRAIIMSPEMHQLVGRLLTNVRVVSQFAAADGIPKGVYEPVTVNGGYLTYAYQGIPILESTFVGGLGAGTMASISLASGGLTGGSFSDGTYYVRVEYLSRDGRSVASPEANIVLAGGGSTQKISITVTPPTDANGKYIAYKYRVYAGSTTGAANTTLKREFPAFSYDSEGYPDVTSPVTTLTLTSLVADTTVTNTADGTDISGDIPNTAVSSVNGENVYLIDLDPVQGMGKYVYTHQSGSAMQGLVNVRQLAEVDAYSQFLLYTTGAIVPAFPDTSFVAQGLRVA